MPRSPAAPMLTVYFDGAAHADRVRFAVYKLDARRGGVAIAWHDIAQEPEALAEFGVDAETAAARLHVVDGDGTLFAGADALALLWSALPGYRRLGRVLAVPGVNRCLKALEDGPLARALHRARQFKRERGFGGRGDGAASRAHAP